MRTSVLVVLAATLSVRADNPKEDQVQQELRRFKGTWRLVSLEVNGGPDQWDGLKYLTLTVRGNRVTYTEVS